MWQTIVRILNPYTKTMVDVQIEVHKDDIEWVVANWDAIFRIDWEIYKEQCNRI